MEGHSVGAGHGCDTRFSKRAFGDKENLSFFESLFGFNSGPEACASSSDHKNIAIDDLHFGFILKSLPSSLCPVVYGDKKAKGRKKLSPFDME
jgi:hypothetical protein